VLTDSRILCPARIPIVAEFLNRFVAPTFGFRWMCLTNWVVARLPLPLPAESSVSVICPCRNESGNIPEIVRRFPRFGGPAELVFVEGNSRDNTLAECHRVAAENPQVNVRVFQQVGRGKGDAVRLGFAEARHDVLLILDADLTVPPEELPGFVNALTQGHAEFVNGSRLVYPLENEAMRFLNLVANKCFALGFSWLLGQPIKDTLCGTKVLLKRDYEQIASQRSYFGDFDPFGDFDLIFGAAKLGLKLRDYPVHYRARTFGETQISRFRHGWMLLKMYVVALFKLKWR
jgi:glycosyltransferase involved in cell wall biosynthesis